MSQKLTTPPYKGSGGHWLTAQLFYERWIDLKEHEQTFLPIFSFNGKEGYIDARSTFVELEDPTGYKWAVKYLGSWKHFEKLMETGWFPPQVAIWKEELRVKLRAGAIMRIREIAATSQPGALAAAKFLASLDAPGRGRPSKEEIKGETKRILALQNAEDEDAERIGLNKDLN